ncbi:hypothetical protein DRQ50_06585 [bacterium]|nr:MAG: hypothetical protein DRQ50_06585 [bacterium]
MQDATTPTAAAPHVHPMGMGFAQTLGDMRFMGWVSLIYGILTCLSILGAIVGVPLIIASHRFIEGVNRFDMYRQNPGAQDELRTGFHELGRSFRIMKILVIIHIFLIVGYIFFLFFLGGIGLLSELANS